jgi:hypothetical protein
MNTIPQDLVAPLNAFLTSVNTAIEIDWKNKGYTFNVAPKVGVHNIGKRYARLALFEKQKDDSWKAGSVYVFLDVTTGSILKGSWSAPVANGVRGNINDSNVLSKVTPYGAAYLHGGNVGSIASILSTNAVKA